MVDFLTISAKSTKRGVTEITPDFLLYPKNKPFSEDVMIRGGDFYAIWVESEGRWSTIETDALRLIDAELDNYAKENADKFDGAVKIMYMRNCSTGSITKWHNFCKQHMRDTFQPLNEKIIFSNTPTNKKDYASMRLNYPLEKGECPAYNEIMSVLYSDEERHKIEWAIGSIITGASKTIQKFIVLYGAPGTGKGTVINIIQKLFGGMDLNKQPTYWKPFDAKSLGSSNASFALEPFKSNPLVAIQHDGDLSNIEDNTRLNSLISHESMPLNTKYEKIYATKFNAFLFMGSNKPVKITDARSGIIRRLIDVTPTGNKINGRRYNTLWSMIDFELGAIAYHCMEVYLENPDIYEKYVPLRMIGATNDFYNFVVDEYTRFKKADGVSLQSAYELYKIYCDEANVKHKYPRSKFREELKAYFREFKERWTLEDGTRVRSYYIGFNLDKFEGLDEKEEELYSSYHITFDQQISMFDSYCADIPAQYATKKGAPIQPWSEVTTVLSDIDTSKLHYVNLPENHIVIDFDIPDENGKKSFEKNLEAASKWPPTYAELSKSEAGIHLHYIYTGDPTKLENLYSEHVEIKVFTGNSALRRKLTKCNNLPIVKIGSGLPLKGEKKVVNSESIKSEKGLRDLIIRNLNKSIHPSTKSSIDFIYKILNDAYDSGLKYDVSDMRSDIFNFASQSTNQAKYCQKLVPQMKFASADHMEVFTGGEDDNIIFYDIECYPNLFLICWKVIGEGKTVVKMINPGPEEVEKLLGFKLAGFNCRRYDNHMIYGRFLGEDLHQLYRRSSGIINSKKGDQKWMLPNAYNVSYTDIYDFSSQKQSLKKWEIELAKEQEEKIGIANALMKEGMPIEEAAKRVDLDIQILKGYLDGTLKKVRHLEMGLPWDQPVPKELWPKVAEYCENDVLATEAVFLHLKADWTARKILADVAGLTVNDTTNSLTTRIIFGNDKKPQGQFNYRDMGNVEAIERHGYLFKTNTGSFVDLDNEWTAFDADGKPIFPGYYCKGGKSVYRGEEVGEGGYVYAEPGMYGNVALLDIASMHPSSIVAEELFGPKYTQRFKDILDARIAIKHGELNKARRMLDGKLAKYLEDESQAKDLAQALKIAINSVYGLTAASFENPFHDIRNKDNIVAKRGALFMVNLKHEVQKRGFTVAHIKTDSIKIPDATPEIISFVMAYGELYGYTFEHEETYERMCLVNRSTYIAKYKVPHKDKRTGNDIWWTATGDQFKVPYVFKTLFSHEPLYFHDYCETKASTKGDLYLDMNEGLPNVELHEKELEKAEKKHKSGKLSDAAMDAVRQDLEPRIAEGHNYIFIGRVGQFCPIKRGCGGGLLYCKRDGKYVAAAGTTGYRWLESEVVRSLGKEECIDISYYEKLANEAVEDINKQGDYNWFVSDEPYIKDFMNIPEDTDEELPWDD